MNADTIIVHDRRHGRSFIGSTRSEALKQFTQTVLTQRADGGWYVEVRVNGFTGPIRRWYSSSFNREEVVHEVSVDTLGDITRNYASRYTVFFAERQ